MSCTVCARKKNHPFCGPPLHCHSLLFNKLEKQSLKQIVSGLFLLLLLLLMLGTPCSTTILCRVSQRHTHCVWKSRHRCLENFSGLQGCQAGHILSFGPRGLQNLFTERTSPLFFFFFLHRVIKDSCCHFKFGSLTVGLLWSLSSALPAPGNPAPNKEGWGESASERETAAKSVSGMRRDLPKREQQIFQLFFSLIIR